MTLSRQQIDACRRQFPALARCVEERPAVFMDGPAGTQVPQRVIDAISGYLVRHNANHGGRFETSRESDQQLAEARQALADFLGAEDADCIVFGPNMTTLTFALSRSLGRNWHAGDEVVVTRLDHDANVTPWVMAARDAGAAVRQVDIRPDDATLDLEGLRSQLTDRTRLVAVSCASNATGSLQPVAQICDWVHDAGGLVFLDAVHYAPHGLVDVNAWGCDFLACSAYKFFGPHVGVLWGRRELLEQLPAYKVRPAPEDLPDKWMTGTANHECIVGAMAAVDYLADVGREVANDQGLTRRDALGCAYQAIGQYERDLVWSLLSRLSDMAPVRVWGITDPRRADQRCPTVSITRSHWSSAQLAEHLGRRGIFVWHGNYYALGLTEALGLEPDGMVRLGLVHYNTAEEVDRLVSELAALTDRPGLLGVRDAHVTE